MHFPELYLVIYGCQVKFSMILRYKVEFVIENK